MARSRNTADATVALAAQVGYLSGLTLSRASATTFGVSVGAARNEDSGATRFMALPTAITKSLSAWAAGTNNGGLDTGSVANNTWYHVHLIRKDSDGTIDALYSASVAAPTMPAGYTARRRIGSFKTDGSSQITAFKQTGDVFRWDVPVQEFNATNPGVSAVTRTLTVPTGLSVLPIINLQLANATTASVYFLASDLAQTDSTPSGSAYHILSTAATGGRQSVVVSDIPTNTSAQIRTRLNTSGASDSIVGVTYGWVDTRGK